MMPSMVKRSFVADEDQWRFWPGVVRQRKSLDALAPNNSRFIALLGSIIAANCILYSTNTRYMSFSCQPLQSIMHNNNPGARSWPESHNKIRMNQRFNCTTIEDVWRVQSWGNIVGCTWRNTITNTTPERVWKNTQQSCGEYYCYCCSRKWVRNEWRRNNQ